MNKKILFITENNFNGFVPRDYNNMRVEFAWMCALNAKHVSLYNISEITENFDLVILIIPKDISKINDFSKLYLNITSILSKNKGKFAIMQEGPHWYFQDYSVENQIKFHSILLSADFMLCHNEIDVRYFSGIIGKHCYIMQSLIIEDSINEIDFNIERRNVIIGGNFVSWYSGFDSYFVAKDFQPEHYIYSTSMGRKKQEEENIKDLIHIPYLIWTDWINRLNNFKYAIHLMRTHAAGTFALNCSFLGIPCIGYYGLDTQQILHPSTTVELGDIYGAREIANKLKDDDFYKYCVNETTQQYNLFYREDTFIKQFEYIIKEEIDGKQ